MAEKSDQAAMAAVESFFDADTEAAADNEVPAEPVSQGMTEAYKNAAAREQQDQQDELEQSGDSDPTQPNGIPAEKQEIKKADKAQIGKPPVASNGSETPDGEAGIDPILRDIAKEAGWTDERIDKMFALDPAMATEILTDVAGQYADLSRQYLELNPASSQAASSSAPPAQVPVPQTSQVSGKLPDALSDTALAKLAETEGEASVNLVKAIRDHFVGQQSALEQRVQAAEQRFSAAETQAVAQEASTAVASLREKFPKLYGSSDDPKLMTVQEYNTYVNLVTTADQIRSGAIARGQNMSVKDALLRSHRIVGHESLKTQARTELQGKIVTRSRQAIAKPTQRNNPKAPGTGSRSTETAVEATAQKMAEIGFSDDD